MRQSKAHWLTGMTLFLLFPVVSSAQTNHSEMRINEVMFDPGGVDRGGEWIELFNAGSTPARLAGWTIVNRTGRTLATLPDWQLPAKGYLVVHFGVGSNEADMSDLRGDFFTGKAAEVLGNTSDEIALYRGKPGAKTIADFVAYAFNQAHKPGPPYAHAVAAKIWPADAVFDREDFIEEGNSIGRDAKATDTNTPEDWSGDGGFHGPGPSPGRINDGPMSYELGVGPGIAVAPLVLGEVTQAEIDKAKAAVKKALDKIKKEYSQLLKDSKLPPIDFDKLEIKWVKDGKPVNGKDGKPVNGKGKKQVKSKITFSYDKNLTHKNRPAAGKAHVPKGVGADSPVELDLDDINVEWKMLSVLIHELLHSAFFNDPKAGYWKWDVGEKRWKGTHKDLREKALKVSEAICYLANLRFLLSIQKQFEAPQTEEAKKQANEYRARLRFKAAQLKHYMGSAINDMEQMTTGGKEWTQYGTYWAGLLLAQRDRYVETLLRVHDADEEGLTDRDVRAVWRRVQELNRIAVKAKKKPLTSKDVEQAARKLGWIPDKERKKLLKARRARLEKEIRAKQAELTELTKPYKNADAEVTRLENYIENELPKLVSRKKNPGTYAHFEKLLKKAREALEREKKKIEQAAVKAKIEELQKEIKDLKKKKKSKKLSARTVETGDRLAKATVLPPNVFATVVGIQGHAGLEYFSLTGNLDGVRQWNENLQAYSATLPASETTDSARDELTLVTTAVETIDKMTGQIRSELTSVRDQIGKGGQNAQQLAQILTKPPQERVTLPKNIQEVTTSADFAEVVFDRFAPGVAEELVIADAPQSGEAVIKGGAVLDAQSGTANVEATIMLTFEADDPQTGGDQTQAMIVQTDEKGKYEAKLPPGSRLTQIHVGGSDIISAPQQTDLSPWDQLDEELEDRSFDKLVDLVDSSNFMYEVVRYRTTGQEIAAEQLAQLSPEEEDRRPGAAFQLADAVFGGLKQPEKPVLAALTSAGLRRQLEATKVGQSIAEAVDESVVLVQAEYASGADGQTVTARKPEQVVVVTGKLATDEQVDSLDKQVHKAAQAAVETMDQVTVESAERYDLPIDDQTVLVYDIVAEAADGSPVAVDRKQLQQGLDAIKAADKNVLIAEGAQLRLAKAKPNDPHFTSKGSWGQDYSDQWALRRMGFGELDAAEPSAWSRVVEDGQPCVVAVIGSGVDWTHPELLGQMWVNMEEIPFNGVDDDGNGYVDDLFGWNFRDGNDDVMDYSGHDTHIAGIIAARWNNGRGIAGINPHARIMALKVANYLGQANSIDISRAIYYAADQGARVINISYGGKPTTQIEEHAIDYARSHGALVVVAAGNEAADASKLGPAANRGVLTVAGTTSKDKRAQFSNWGQPIDLSTPAMDVLSLRARGTDFLLYVGENPDYKGGTGIVGKGKDLYRASGTSFAAPMVSGVASLIWSIDPELTARQVQNKLLMGTDDVEVPGWDQHTGTGVLDARKAIKADPDDLLLASISQVAPVRREGKVQIEVRGRAEGNKLDGRWLQIGFGEKPGKDDWTTIGFSREQVSEGVLGVIPADRLNRRGKWTIRLLVRGGGKVVKQARATLNIQ